jgi:hypothetical protein
MLSGLCGDARPSGAFVRSCRTTTRSQRTKSSRTPWREQRKGANKKYEKVDVVAILLSHLPTNNQPFGMQKNKCCVKKKITLEVPFHAGWLEEGDFQNEQIDRNKNK